MLVHYFLRGDHFSSRSISSTTNTDRHFFCGNSAKKAKTHTHRENEEEERARERVSAIRRVSDKEMAPYIAKTQTSVEGFEKEE